MNRPPLDWQDVAVQRERVLRDFSRSSGKVEMDLWAPLRGTRSRPSDRARSGLAAPRFDQAQGVQPIPITVNLSAIVGGGLLAWIPLVILIALYLGSGK